MRIRYTNETRRAKYVKYVGDVLEAYFEEKGIEGRGATDPSNRSDFPAALVEFEQVPKRMFHEVLYPGLEELCKKLHVNLEMKVYSEQTNVCYCTVRLKINLDKAMEGKVEE